MHPPSTAEYSTRLQSPTARNVLELLTGPGSEPGDRVTLTLAPDLPASTRSEQIDRFATVAAELWDAGHAATVTAEPGPSGDVLSLTIDGAAPSSPDPSEDPHARTR